MKKFAWNGLKYLGILLGSILLGTILLILVYSLPVAPMKENAMRSTEIYDYEGVYPQLMWGYKMSQLDNSTDATMILNAIYAGKQSVVEKAIQVYRTEYHGENPVKSLTNYANDVQADVYNVSYSRYWHGYLVILKPLLLFFDVADIRMINMIVQMVLLCYILYLMIKKEYVKYIPAFITAILLLNPVAIALSFQFSTIYYLMLFAVLFVLLRRKLPEKEMTLFFFLLGIATAFFDFLTYPLVALYFPLILILSQEDSWKEACKKGILCSVMWGIGYIGMWCGKWCMGSVLMQKNLWADALLRAADYESMNYGDGKINALQVVLKNMMVLIKWPVLFGAIALCIYYIKQFIKRMAMKRKMQLLWLCPFGMIALVPFVWYLAAGSHSYIHYWYTYRELCVSIFAVLVGITKLILSCGEENDEEKDTSH